MTVLIVASQFNSMITQPMLQRCLEGLKESDIQKIELIEVPGAAEIPIAIHRALQNKAYTAVITIGCIIKGETDHYDAVSRLVTDGISRLSLDHSTPIFFEVLMVDSYQKAEARIEKGYEVVKTMLDTLKAIPANSL